MLKLNTSQKIFFASLISKILIFFFGKKKRIIERNGIRYFVDLNEGIDLGIFLNIKNEKKIFNIVKILGKHITIIDIGSNIGSVTLPLAKIFSKSKVISIEPTFYAFSKLKKNINLNPILKKRIKLENVFVSNQNKIVNKVYSSWNLSNDSKKHKVHFGTLKKTSKKIKKLDKICSKVKKVDFIKIDVDGHELDVLKSGIKTIKKHKPFIYFEFAPYLYKEFHYTPEILINFIKKDLNYLFYDEKLEEVSNIESFIKRLKRSSQNFFLIHKSFKNKD